MKSFDKWRLLQRVLFTNAIAVAGILLGFAISDVTPTARARVYIVVLVVTFLNLMLVVVRWYDHVWLHSEHPVPRR